MEEVEINECDCKFCYYGVYDCENSCPHCDIEVRDELNKSSEEEVTKDFYSSHFYDYEYEYDPIEDKGCVVGYNTYRHVVPYENLSYYMYCPYF